MGVKRLSIVVYLTAFVACVGVPAWWQLTSIHRPKVAAETETYFLTQRNAEHRLPIALHVHVLHVTARGTQAAVQLPTALDLQRQTGVQHLEVVAEGAASATACGASGSNDEHGKHTERNQIGCSALERLGRLGAVPDDPSAASQWLREADAELTAAVSAPVRTAGRYDVFVIVSGAAADQGSAAHDSKPPHAVLGVDRVAFVVLDEGTSASKLSQALLSLMGKMLGGQIQRGSARVMPHDDGTAPQGRALPTSAASETTLAFCLAVAEPAPLSGWRFHEWDAVVWQPLKSRLAPLLSLRIESRVLLYAPARTSPTAIAPAQGSGNETSDAAAPRHGGSWVHADQLPTFVDYDAWSLEYGRVATGHVHPLAPETHSIPETVLHFVAYVPRRGERPMSIAAGKDGLDGVTGAGDRGFVTTDWGALVIVNGVDTCSSEGCLGRDGRFDDATATAEAECAEVPSEAMREYTGLALQQFRTFLGLPAATPEAASIGGTAAVAGRDNGGNKSGNEGWVTILSPGVHGLALWELDALLRRRYAVLMHDAADALVDMFSLVRSLPNLEIPDLIGEQIALAEEHLKAAAALGVKSESAGASDGKSGRYQEALDHARAARIAAATVASHHSIVSQHNYPDQHKVALYLPMFAPVSAPFIATLARELKRIMRKRT